MKAPLAGGAPTTLFPGTAAAGSTWGIAANASNLYWFALASGGSLNDGSVMTMSLDGGPTTTLASGQIGQWGIALDGSDVYWASQVTMPSDTSQGPGAVLKIPLDGSAAPVTFASGQLFPSVIAIDATSVYWGGGIEQLDWPGPGTSPATTSGLSRAPRLGGAPETIFPTSVLSPKGLILCPDGVCWADQRVGTVMRFTACSP